MISIFWLAGHSTFGGEALWMIVDVAVEKLILGKRS
jgi:hypothetical protein